MAKKRSNAQKSGEPVNAVVSFTGTAYRGDAPALDINQQLIKNPASTFFMKVEGNTWEDQGIFDGDIIVIDRSLMPKRTDTVVATLDGEFVLSHIALMGKNEAELWGVVTHVVHRRRR